MIIGHTRRQSEDLGLAGILAEGSPVEVLVDILLRNLPGMIVVVAESQEPMSLCIATKFKGDTPEDSNHPVPAVHL